MTKFIFTAIIFFHMSVSASAATFEEQDKAKVDANIPSAEVFSELLHRDLLTHFRGSGIPDNTKAEYQLLRDTPTGPVKLAKPYAQAYPVYYLWVRMLSGATVLNEGVVRALAIERNRFEITQFLSRAEILADPSRVSKIVPLNLVQNVISLAERK
jgi:hypothetical protein